MRFTSSTVSSSSSSSLLSSLLSSLMASLMASLSLVRVMSSIISGGVTLSSLIISRGEGGGRGSGVTCEGWTDLE